VPVEPWTTDEAAGYLTFRTTDTDRAAAEALAQALGGLPLAVEQAAAYCRSACIGLHTYQDRLHDDLTGVLAQGAPPGYPGGPVSSTIAVALRRVADSDPAARDLLITMAFLAPTGIPRDLVTAAPALLPPDLQAAAGDPLRLDRTVRALLDSSLAGTDRPGQLRVHQLVQDLVRHQASGVAPQAGAVDEWLDRLAGLILAALPQTIDDDVDACQRYAQLLPHAMAVSAHAERCQASSPAIAFLRHRVGTLLHARGDEHGAVRLLQAAADGRRELLGPEHLDTLKSLNNLGLVRHALGDHRAARSLHETVLSVRRRILGDDHEHTLASMGNLGLALRRLGDLDGARSLHEQELAACEKLLGDDDPDTLTAMSNLACVLNAQHEFAHARELHHHVLTTRTRVLSPEHPDTIASMNGLANALHGLGDLSAAREMHEREVQLCIRILGENHPDTLESMHDLANTITVQREINAAAALYAHVRQVRARVLGATRHAPRHPGHPGRCRAATLRCLNNR
jgi:hypothetical protein